MWKCSDWVLRLEKYRHVKRAKINLKTSNKTQFKIKIKLADSDHAEILKIFKKKSLFKIKLNALCEACRSLKKNTLFKVKLNALYRACRSLKKKHYLR